MLLRSGMPPKEQLDKSTISNRLEKKNPCEAPNVETGLETSRNLLNISPSKWILLVTFNSLKLGSLGTI